MTVLYLNKFDPKQPTISFLSAFPKLAGNFSLPVNLSFLQVFVSLLQKVWREKRQEMPRQQKAGVSVGEISQLLSKSKSIFQLKHVATEFQFC